MPVWYAIWAPAGTPQPIIDALNRKIVELAPAPEMVAKMQNINVIVPVQTPAEMLAYYNADSASHLKLIQDAKITLDGKPAQRKRSVMA